MKNLLFLFFLLAVKPLYGRSIDRPSRSLFWHRWVRHVLDSKGTKITSLLDMLRSSGENKDALMKAFVHLFAILLLVPPPLLDAQKRYFDPVFPQVKVTSNVTYGVNATVLYLAPAGEAIPQQLKMDVYEPEGDTAVARPLVILFHSGLFLPPQVNGGCNGTVLDGEVVALARRLAQSGYVVAAADYRLGWAGITVSQTERVLTFVNAIHRGVQDSRTCVRFFKKGYSEGNPFRIDPDKITLWGCGTGGYLSLGAATLDSMSDWDRPRFSTPNYGLMVQESVNGNLYGTSVGIVTPDYYPVYPVGDTLCYPNHTNFNSDFAMAVNMGAVLLDSFWLGAGDVPILSFAAPEGLQFLDEPCGAGGLYLYLDPGFPLLGQVIGSCRLQERQAGLGNNAIWENAGFDDALSIYSSSINNGIEGFYPFWGTNIYAPWAFSTSLSPYGVTTAMCDTSHMHASAYIDTVMRYFAPRACVLLGLSPNCQQVGTREPNVTKHALQVNPNPAHGDIHIKADAPMLSIELLDTANRVVYNQKGLWFLEANIPRGDWPSGIYWARVCFSEGTAITMVMWQ